jgi:hypothetical protein
VIRKQIQSAEESVRAKTRELGLAVEAEKEARRWSESRAEARKTRESMGKVTGDEPLAFFGIGYPRDAVAIAQAEERAACKEVDLCGAETASLRAQLAYREADLACSRAELRQAEKPTEAAAKALADAQERMAQALIKAALAHQAASEARVKSAEAQLGVARKKLTAAGKFRDRVQARYGGARVAFALIQSE